MYIRICCACVLAHHQSLDRNEMRHLLAKGTGRNWDGDKVSSFVEDIDADNDGSVGELEFLHNTVQWTPVMQ